MAGIILEPLAASLRFESPQPRSMREWSGIVKGLLENLASLSMESGAPVIGHIKCLSLIGADHYLRGSAVSHIPPAEVETNASEARADLTLSLNMLVYGLPCPILERIVKQGALECCASHGITVAVARQTSPNLKVHDHHDDRTGH